MRHSLSYSHFIPGISQANYVECSLVATLRKGCHQLSPKYTTLDLWRQRVGTTFVSELHALYSCHTFWYLQRNGISGTTTTGDTMSKKYWRYSLISHMDVMHVHNSTHVAQEKSTC